MKYSGSTIAFKVDVFLLLKPYFLSADLLALDKDGSFKPRPIAVGEMFYILVTSYTTDTLRKSVSEVLFPIQLVGVEGGVETASHFGNAALTDETLNYVGFSADQKILVTAGKEHICWRLCSVMILWDRYGELHTGHILLKHRYGLRILMVKLYTLVCHLMILDKVII